VKSRMPTRLNNGEGRAGWGSNRQKHPFRFAGVMGTARWEGITGNRGRSDPDGGRNVEASFGCRSGRESERVIRPLMPGNAGGGKGPHFLVCF
jgi:hypothetical protein